METLIKIIILIIVPIVGIASILLSVHKDEIWEEIYKRLGK